MDVQTLLSEAKARFAHNTAKEALKEKYSSKLLVAEQNGLWKADIATIGALQAFNCEKVVLFDTHNIPVEVDRIKLIEKLTTVYDSVMNELYKEWKALENKR